METFIRGLPKAELHVHIEGTLEPALMLALAERNRVAIKYSSIDAIRRAYAFTSLQSFLDLYYEGMKVLVREQDFYDLTMAYLERARDDRVRHAEIFFDPQAHSERGIGFAKVIGGIRRALADGLERFGISSHLILCFLRHLSEDSARATLEEALAFREGIVAVGLDSSEMGHPPEKFAKVFAEARGEGFKTVAHAGEEGPPQYIWQALDLLQVSRIDHGIRCLEDPKLVERLVRERVPLTVCPLSNVRLRVFETMGEHNLGRLLELGIRATVNSDDPAYFGGYVSDNFLAAQRALGLEVSDIHQMARNAFEASFLEGERRDALVRELDDYVAGFSPARR